MLFTLGLGRLAIACVVNGSGPTEAVLQMSTCDDTLKSLLLAGFADGGVTAALLPFYEGNHTKIERRTNPSQYHARQSCLDENRSPATKANI